MSAVAVAPALDLTELARRSVVVNVELTDIYTDRYQRTLNERWLKRTFDPFMLGTPIVSERPRRNKTYAAIDGQHRIELCRRYTAECAKQGLPGWPVMACVVLSGLSIEEEAELFVRLQQERRTPTPFQQHIGHLVAKNPRAIAIERIVSDTKLELSESNDAPGFIKCVRLLENIYDDDPARLAVVLRLIQGTWRELPQGRSERLIRGVWYFVQDTPELDEDRFVDRLSPWTPSALFTRAQNKKDGDAASGGLPGYVAEVIGDEYARRRAANR